MPNRDHAPLVVNKFSGLYDRGDDEVCPPDHFSVCQNVAFTDQDNPRTRDGLVLNHVISHPKRVKVYKRVDEVPRDLILNDTGSIYDSLNLTTPILTIVGMTDFSAADYGNRVYISPHDGNRGLSGEKLYVYDGTTCRPAGGATPSGSMVAANSALSGNIDAGTHLIAVSYETESGFITQPGPALYASFNATGLNQVDVAGIPIGPAGTVARRLLSTKRIPNYDGNQDAYEFFFIAEGRIPNNTATTITVNYFDADLVSSADYLFDQLNEIPAGVAVTTYSERLVVLGTFLGPSVAWFSRQNDPESFDAAEGFKEIALDEAGGLQNGVEFRDSFYMTKQLHTYVVVATESSPIFWKPVSIDGGIGSVPHGIAILIDKTSDNTDRFLVASKIGLALFDGSYNEPEFSWKVREIWSRINENYFQRVQVLLDPVAKLIYVNLPLDSATECSHVLVGDFKTGLTPVNVRWSLWKFPTVCPSINLNLSENNTPYLMACQVDNVYSIVKDTYNDYSNAIETIMRFAPLTLDDEGGSLHFDSLRLRVRGSGNLQIKLWGEDSASSQTLLPPVLSNAPGMEFTRLANFVNEKCSVELKVNQASERFNILKLVLYAAPIYAERPM